MSPLLSLLVQNPLVFAILVPVLLYSVIMHEVAHGAVAYAFGDDTAKKAHRLTLNPIPHLDLVGMLMIFLVGFGWARPVPVDYRRLKYRPWATVLVALAGCATNIVMAAIALYLLRLESVKTLEFFPIFLVIFAQINMVLAALNLIPIPPLDGSKVLTAFLSEKYRRYFDRYEIYGMLLLIVLLATGFLSPVINFIYNAIMGVIG